VGSCPGTFNSIVTAVVNIPSAAVSSNVQICKGGHVTLNASGGTIYHWWPLKGLNDSTIYNPIASPDTTTMYYVKVTNSTGCSAIDSVKVTVGNLVANAGNDATICPGDSANLQASGGTNYSWSPTTGLNNPNISNPKASPAVTTAYIVTVSDGVLCSATDTVTVYVHSVAVYVGKNDTICPKSSIQLNASDSIGYSYMWTPSTNLSSTTIYNPIASPASTTTYIVTVKNGNGCTASNAITIYVIQSVHAAFSSDTAICLNDTIMFTDHSTSTSGNLISWAWTFGDGTSASLQNPVHTYNSPGQYTVTIKVTNAAGCKDSIMHTVIVNNVPVANFSVSDTAGCIPLSVTFTDHSTNATSWSWDFDDPTSGSGNYSTLQNPTHIFLQSGTYNVTLTVITANHCSGSISLTVHVFTSPDAQFSAAPNPVFINSPVAITNTSTNGNTYYWNFGNGQTSNLQNPLPVAYLTPGIDTILLIVTNADGCKDSMKFAITVNDEINLKFPNIITPNGDGKNDNYIITDIDKVPVNHFVVFNRWGRIVFEVNNYQNNWDGGNLSDGVYYFIFTYQKKETHGIITILK